MKMKNRKIMLDENQLFFEDDYGYIIYKKDKPYCEICLITVDKADKNKGYGTKLLSSFIKKMKNEKIVEFNLDAWVTFDGIFDIVILTKFYEKFGFKETERIIEEEGTRVFMYLNIRI